MRHWINAFVTLIFPTVVAGLVALIWNTTLGLITLCLWLFVALWSERQNISFFESWLNAPKPGSRPAVTARWEQVFKGLTKIQKRQRASEAALSRALDRFEQAARALPDAVILVNKASQIEWCNTRAEEYFQLKLNRDHGVQIDYLLRHPAFRVFMSNPDPEIILTLRLPRTGADRLVSVQMIPFGHEQGLLLAQDITEREQLEITRRDFVANISHELRTPLTVIQGFLETFEDVPSDNPEIFARGVELMSDQSRRMNRLITDLLALSRLENSSVVHEDIIDVSKLTHHVAAEARTLSNNKHRIDIHAASDLKILGAEDEIRSALSNLISNAVRYSPTGGTITISWALIHDEPVFSCKDQGVGIAAEHLERLTERFYRVDKGRSQETGGTGLGLAIVKHVLNRHDARLKITSNPGRGSEFSIFFSSEKIAPQQELAV